MHLQRKERFELAYKDVWNPGKVWVGTDLKAQPVPTSAVGRDTFP